ncbi:hypothetical protein Clacol_007140 [Clathrus columnatus]|uniref:Alpha/beta hydrolase fold-3 domain-containing protein n=1 Tax=Clathrus columnatus TaxID=1419009 RepID=A0AAV5AJP0_9AGAM|nr:hypothetical protein Clacol_007140 [Clathrus columnatus]
MSTTVSSTAAERPIKASERIGKEETENTTPATSEVTAVETFTLGPPLPPVLDLGDQRPFVKKWRIRILSTILRYTIDFLSLPLYLWPVGNRLRTTIKTETTGRCRLCIYYPKPNKTESKLSTPRGVLVHLHGGGWSADGLSSTLSTAKIPLIAPIDPKKIALSGASAGSNLAASVTLLSLTRPLPNNAKITALGLLYPSLNFTVPYRDKLARVDPTRVLPPWMSKLWLKAYLPPPRDIKDPYISPALAPQEYLKQFPPTLILTAEYDYLAYEAEEWVILLQQAGVPVDHKRFAKVGHAFDGMPTLGWKQRKLNEQARKEAWGMMVKEFQIGLTDVRE